MSIVVSCSRCSGRMASSTSGGTSPPRSSGRCRTASPASDADMGGWATCGGTAAGVEASGAAADSMLGVVAGAAEAARGGGWRGVPPPPSSSDGGPESLVSAEPACGGGVREMEAVFRCRVQAVVMTIQTQTCAVLPGFEGPCCASTSAVNHVEHAVSMEQTCGS